MLTSGCYVASHKLVLKLAMNLCTSYPPVNIVVILPGSVELTYPIIYCFSTG
jgi:hypothetical protein